MGSKTLTIDLAFLSGGISDKVMSPCFYGIKRLGRLHYDYGSVI